MNYVMSDIHGAYHKFMKMLSVIGFTKADRLYVTGDAIDRGDSPINVLLFIMQMPNIELILGNHEEMFLSYIASKRKVRWKHEVEKSSYIECGGKYTIEQFEALSIEKQKVIEDYLLTRPLYRVIDHYVLVHSGMVIRDRNNLNLERALQQQTRDDFLWTKDSFILHPAIPNYILIFGHTPTNYLYDLSRQGVPHKLKIWHDKIYKDKIGIDCGAGYEDGRLGCLCLDNLKEYYV